MKSWNKVSNDARFWNAFILIAVRCTYRWSKNIFYWNFPSSYWSDEKSNWLHCGRLIAWIWSILKQHEMTDHLKSKHTCLKFFLQSDCRFRLSRCLILNYFSKFSSSWFLYACTSHLTRFRLGDFFLKIYSLYFSKRNPTFKNLQILTTNDLRNKPSSLSICSIRLVWPY